MSSSAIERNHLGFPIPRLVALRQLEEDLIDEPEVHSLPKPYQLETPFTSMASFAPSILAIPTRRVHDDDAELNKPATRFAVWLTTKGTIEYAFYDDNEWTLALPAKFPTKTVLSAPVAAKLNEDIFICWVEKEGGIQISKIGEMDSFANVAPYAPSMKSGVCMIADPTNNRLVVAWNERDCLQVAAVDVVGNVDEPVAVGSHRGSFDMAFWKGEIFIVTGGARVWMYVLDAKTLDEKNAVETEFRSQGAVRLAVFGARSPRFYLAFANAQGQLSLRVLKGFLPQDLDPRDATSFKDIAIKTAPSIAFDTEAHEGHITWVNADGTMTFGKLGDEVDWPTANIDCQPFIFNPQVTGAWYVQLGIPSGQATAPPKFQALIGPPGGPYTTYQFPASLTFNVTTLPTSWEIKILYRYSGVLTYSPCKSGVFSTVNKWKFYTTPFGDTSGNYCAIMIFDSGWV